MNEIELRAKLEKNKKHMQKLISANNEKVIALKCHLKQVVNEEKRLQLIARKVRSKITELEKANRSYSLNRSGYPSTVTDPIDRIGEVHVWDGFPGMSLEVISYTNTEDGRRDVYNWKCNCGAIKPLIYSEVTSGKTKSCGCYRRYTHRAMGAAFQAIKETGSLPYTIDSRGCHICSIGSNTGFGGKVTSYDGVRYLVHRLQYELLKGPIPDGLVVRHKCDVPGCINIDHLELGTQADNVRDMMDRGRQRTQRGSKNHWAKLTEDDVRQIRVEDKPVKELARLYGVHQDTITEVIKRRSWVHVV